MHQKLTHFISAINSFKGKNEVDPKQLEKICLECITQVRIIFIKKRTPDVDYELFRLLSTELLLLSCSHVRDHITINTDHKLSCITRYMCTLDESTVLYVINSLKSCKYLKGIVCWFPLESNCVLLNVLMGMNILSPAVLITFENLVYGMLISAQSNEYSDCFEHTIKEIEIFLKRILSSINVPEESSNTAFLMYCLMNALVLMFNYISGHSIPFYSLYAMLEEALPKPVSYPLNEKYKVAVIDLVEVIFENVEPIADMISCNVWIEWENVKTNLYDFPQELLLDGFKQPNPPDNIQKHISYNAYRISQFLDSDDLCMKLNRYSKFNAFLQQIATRPRDTNNVVVSLDDLTNVDTTLSPATMESILKNETIFLSENSLPILQRNIKSYRADAISNFVINAIQFGLQEKHGFSSEWKAVILDYAQLLPTKALIQIIKENLSNGSVEVLKQENFFECLTRVFNQLDSSKNISVDFLHLGLQSGINVVSRSVSHAFEMPGLEGVLLLALENLRSVCFSRNDQGLSVAAAALKKCASEVNSEERKSSFVTLSVQFLQMHEKYVAEETTEGLNFPKELLDNVILHNLNCTSKCLLLDCKASLHILEVIMKMHPTVVFSPRPEFVCSFVTLALLYNNLFCQSFIYSVDSRILVRTLLEAMTGAVKEDRENYTKEIAAIKLILNKCDLHPRCYFLCADAIEAEFIAPTFCDEVFHQLCSNEDMTPDVMEEITIDKYKWSWSLLQILPFADKAEWIKALTATHYSIMKVPPSKSIQTLNVFCKILFTKYREYAEGPLTPEEVSGNLQSLFSVFSSATMVYITDVVKGSQMDEKVEEVCNIGIWWCRRMSKFSNKSEMPTMFVSKLANFLVELLNQFKAESKFNPETADKVVLRESNMLSKSSRIVLSVANLKKSLDYIQNSGLKVVISRKLCNCIEM